MIGIVDHKSEKRLGVDQNSTKFESNGIVNFQCDCICQYKQFVVHSIKWGLQYEFYYSCASAFPYAFLYAKNVYNVMH